MASLSVIIPSRVQPSQAHFLTQAIGSVAAQRVRSWLTVEVLVGLDPHATIPDIDIEDLTVPVRFVNAGEYSGAAAVNAAAAEATGDYLAILEDDDVWDTNHLEVALQALSHCAFVSGTQLEVDRDGTVVRINDFPTPSGWVVHRTTWEQVGPLDTSYRLHQDNEWLGRLAEHHIPRTHLVESTAPLSTDVARQVRPWLATLIDLGGGHVRLERHESPVPLIRRLVHHDSLMHQISANAETNVASDIEYDRLIQRYGRIPW